MNLQINLNGGFFIVGFVWIIHFALDAANVGVDDSDVDGFHRSGVSVVTDARTGLQYLVAPNGGITPRLDARGAVMIDKAAGVK